MNKKEILDQLDQATGGSLSEFELEDLYNEKYGINPEINGTERKSQSMNNPSSTPRIAGTPERDIQRTIDVKAITIPESPRMAGETPLNQKMGAGMVAGLKGQMAPALLGGAAMTGMRIMSGEDAGDAIVGGVLSTAGSLGGQVVGESAARHIGRTVGELATEKLAQTAVGQAGKALAAKAAGTAIGATIGSVIPGAGTAVGSLVGSLVGGIAGDMLAKKMTGGMKTPEVDPMSGEMMIDPMSGQPVIRENFRPDAANGMVPGMLSAQQIFDAAKTRNSNLMGSMSGMNYGMEG